MVELKSNPNKLEDDFEKQIIPPRVIFPIIFGLLFLEGCDRADAHEKIMMELYKQIKKKDLVYNGKITIDGDVSKNNKVIAQKLGKDIEIDVQFKECGTIEKETIKYCIIYNENIKKFTLKRDGEEREPSDEELEEVLIMVEKRKDAIIRAIEKKEDDEDNESFFWHNFKRWVRQTYKEVTKDF